MERWRPRSAAAPALALLALALALRGVLGAGALAADAATGRRDGLQPRSLTMRRSLAEVDGPAPVPAAVSAPAVLRLVPAPAAALLLPLALPPPAPKPANTSFCNQHMCNAWWIGFLSGAFLLFICVYMLCTGRGLAVVSLGRRAWRGPSIRPFAGVASSRAQDPRDFMRPVAVSRPGKPAAAGAAWECPVCIDEVSDPQQWTLFPCGHGACDGCYAKLLQESPCCPLCRLALTEPDPERMKAWRQVSLNGRVPNRGAAAQAAAGVGAGAAGATVPQHIVIIPLDSWTEVELVAPGSPAAGSPGSSAGSSSEWGAKPEQPAADASAGGGRPAPPRSPSKPPEPAGGR